ncbi:hypothetical protein FO519_002479 [Halicephalobus sp. NKZ332]|nr:hypothetical protein FO519_002479 [Halicephalobus sp. NKZ332]
MECVRSSPVKSWQDGVTWIRSSVDDNAVVPHSAPCSFCSSSCRRAASFPMAHATALPSALKVRSQSESAGLNTLHFPRYLLSEIQNNVLSNNPKFFTENPITQSDSDGDESLTSADSGHTSEDDQNDQSLEFNDTFQSIDANDSKCPLMAAKKKKVRFADDCGCALENVRVMTEPSEIPPKISPSVIRRYKKGSKAFLRALHAKNNNGVLSTDEDSSEDEVDDMYHNRKHASWKIGFTQPASEYIKFRETLEKNKVALENVMLRNDHCKMLGTIKVGNISFEKSVFIRYTSDGWESYLDRPAVYQASSSKAYDTFGFEIEIPMNEGEINKIDFCVCFVADGVEYWDSNDGENYSLISPNTPPKSPQAESTTPRHRRSDVDDAYKMNYESWSRFASWKDLSTEGPYW